MKEALHQKKNGPDVPSIGCNYLVLQECYLLGCKMVLPNVETDSVYKSHICKGTSQRSRVTAFQPGWGGAV